MKKIMIPALAAVMALGLMACGGSQPAAAKSEQPAAQSASASAAESTETGAAAESAEAPAAAADLSAPAVEIAFGDVDAITALGKQMQNFEVAEGTVIKITGLIETLGSTPSIMEANEAGDEKQGISIFLDEGIEVPADDTKVEAVGVAVKGNYFMEFHVSADGFKILE